MTDALPLVDISGLDSPDPAARLAVGEAMRSACADKGFLYVTGHGVPEALIDEMWDTARKFFDLPLDQKMQVSMQYSSCNRGYEPLAAQTLEPGSPPDQKEGYYFGEDLADDHPLVIAGKFNHGANLWPDLPDFRETTETYFRHVRDLGTRLTRGLALSLGLDEDYFDAWTTDPICTVRLLHYPPQASNAHPAQKGAGAHTDFGGMTLLMQDENGGLEVLDKDGGWLPAPPLPGAYVVNLGDLIQRWTNGKYRSTLHRVINRSGRERYSIPTFFNGNPDHVVECIPTCLAPGAKPEHPPVTVAGHLKERYAASYKPAATT